MNLTFPKRLAFLAAAAAIAILLVVIRLYNLQIVEGVRWQATLDHKSRSIRKIEGERGRILDARGALLAADDSGFDLMAVPAGWAGRLHRCRKCAHEMYVRKLDLNSFRRCPQCKESFEVFMDDLSTRCNLEPLAQLLGSDRQSLREQLDARVQEINERVEAELKATTTPMSKEQRQRLRTQLRRDYGWQPAVFRRDVTYEVAREVTLHSDRNPPFRIRESRARRNFGGEPFSHLIGRAPDRVLRARGDGGHGAGLESRFDVELQGEPGWVRRAVDTENRNRLKVVERVSPVKGLDVRLTMAREDQSAAQDALAGMVGAFVVINAQTGAVLALVSAPTFDPDHYAEAVRRANENPDLPGPFFQRAVRGRYPPGSTLKPFTGMAALNSGLLTADDTIQCDKYYVLRGATITNAMTCMGTHGPTALRGALVHSCNTYFQTIVDRLEQAGKEQQFEDTLRLFGLGEPTGLDIESKSIKKLTLRLRSKSYQVPLSARIQAGIGQGRVVLTPAQVARGYAGLATGFLPDLHVVESVGNTPTAIKRTRIPLNPAHFKAVRAGLLAKTRHDESLRYDVFMDHNVATKTGTAQQEKDGTTYFAWLAGFAEAQNDRPPIAFAMVVEDSAEYGGATCGPLVARFLSAYYGRSRE